MLPDLISLAESRALARRLLEPCWKAVSEKSDDLTKYRFLLSLLPADPAGVLQKLEAVKFKLETPRLMLLREIVPALAERDLEEAAAVAESIADPATRSAALVALTDRIPESDRATKAHAARSRRYSKPDCGRPERSIGSDGQNRRALA